MLDVCATTAAANTAYALTTPGGLDVGLAGRSHLLYHNLLLFEDHWRSSRLQLSHWLQRCTHARTTEMTKDNRFGLHKNPMKS